MIRLVLDTNVLLSALLSPASPSAEILSLWRDRKLVVLTAAEQIEEITRVTRYPKLRALLRKQDLIYARNAWIARWVGWICGWGGAALAALGGASTKLYPNDDTLPVWCGLTAAAPVAMNQIFKPDTWAEAYYRGHLLLEEAIGDCELGKGSKDGLVDAWHRAQSGLPGGPASSGKGEAGIDLAARGDGSTG